MASAAEGRRSCSQKSGLFVAHGQAQSTKHEHKAANFDQKMWFWAQSTKHEAQSSKHEHKAVTKKLGSGTTRKPSIMLCLSILPLSRPTIGSREKSWSELIANAGGLQMRV
jgi:hypothetical protein